MGYCWVGGGPSDGHPTVVPPIGPQFYSKRADPDGAVRKISTAAGARHGATGRWPGAYQGHPSSSSAMHRTLFLTLSLIWVGVITAQQDSLLLAHEQHAIGEASIEDGTGAVIDYEPLNGALGGDSIRYCNGYACIGWVEDRYPSGALKHRGYYNDGQLIIYKNYHPDGASSASSRRSTTCAPSCAPTTAMGSCARR